MVRNVKGIKVPSIGKKKNLSIPSLLEATLEKELNLKENFQKLTLSKKWKSSE